MLVPDVNRVIVFWDSDEFETNKYWHRDFREWRSSKDQQFIDSNFDLSVSLQVHYPDVERVEWLNKVPIEASVVLFPAHTDIHQLLLVVSYYQAKVVRKGLRDPNPEPWGTSSQL